MKNIFKILIIIFTCVSTNFSVADNIVISGGRSINSNNTHSSLREYKNLSYIYSVKYEGEHYGLRLDHSLKGDDDGNNYVTGDALFHIIPNIILGAGIMIDRHPLRKTGSYMNFHAIGGLEFKNLFKNNIGLGIYYDHWSNGHIHSLFGTDNVPNPPRNTINLGLIKSFSNN